MADKWKRQGEKMEPDTRRSITLAAVLSLLQPNESVFIMRRISPHELEAVGGTVQELQTIKCMEICGDCKVERLELDIDDTKEEWTEPDTPVLVITIGGKEG